MLHYTIGVNILLYANFKWSWSIRFENVKIPGIHYLTPNFIGIHGWIVYSLVGLLLGLMAYRENLPMTMKSCFYPLMGDRIFGWMGDLIDVVSIMTTLFGVCTSLGLGTRQLNAGLHMINSDIPDDSTWIQVRYYNGLSASYLSNISLTTNLQLCMNMNITL